MKKVIVLVVMLMIVSSIFAEVVILWDGRLLRGEIVGKKDESIYLASNNNIYLIKLDFIEQIKNDSNQSTIGLVYRKKDFMNDGVETAQLTPLGKREVVTDDDYDVNDIYNPQLTYKAKMGVHSLTLSVLFAGLAWDYFATVGDISDSIDEYKDMEEQYGINYSKTIKNLEKTKTRKIINGSLLTAASIISFAVSFENVEIKASPSSLEVGYKF